MRLRRHSSTSGQGYSSDDGHETSRNSGDTVQCDPVYAAFNADVNGAENIRLNINDESNSESASNSGRDRSTGWLAQPAVHLYDLSCGFQPQIEVVDCRP